MAHIHDITDGDLRFIIDARSRHVTSQNDKSGLIQGDHNSERLTFEVPRYVEGHDMSLCTKVTVHYNNISTDKKEQSRDVYIVDDVQVSPDSDDVVLFSWLISCNATRHAGILSFLICFECLTGTTVDYAWHTALHSDIKVGEGMSNDEHLVEYSDVLEAWRSEIVGAVVRTDSQINNLDKRVTNIEQGLPPEKFVVDSSVAYAKIVPENVCSSAAVEKIGGASATVDGSLVHAKVTEIRSASANLLRPFNTEPVTNNGITMQYLADEDCFVFNGTMEGEAAVAEFIAPFHITVEYGKYLEARAFYVSGSFDGYYGEFSADDGFHEESGGVCCVYTELPHEEGGDVWYSTGDVFGPTHGELQLRFHFSTGFYEGPYYEGDSSLTLNNYKVRVHLTHVQSDSRRPKYIGAYNPNIGSLKIPAEVQALPDYGKTDTYIEWRDDGIYRVTPDGETDISHLLPDDNFIRVEGGGTITAVNEHGFAVSTEIIYQMKGVTA